ncbi:MAG: type II toxin-antitoxin system Phd/YefM family antitoxin [Chitinispirillaceae bacterium]|nr:type II toxin-antitoxin system Phd/YefM family antitoxin [Chitinispirillaceae bacterium]
MKFITVRDFRSRPAFVWKELGKSREMVLTSNGKPIALLTPVSEQTLESTIRSIRKAGALEAVSFLQSESLRRRNDTMTLEDITTEIKAARRRRNRC